MEKRDFHALFAVASDPLIWEQHRASDRYKKNVFTKFFDDGMDSKGALVVLDKASDSMIGSSRFNLIPHSENAIEIGWTFLARKYWGGNYNRSFKGLMMDHAFEFVDDVVYYVAGDNERSKRAVRKLGGKVVDAKESPELIKNAPNYTSFRIRKSDWISSKQFC